MSVFELDRYRLYNMKEEMKKTKKGSDVRDSISDAFKLIVVNSRLRYKRGDDITTKIAKDLRVLFTSLLYPGVLKLQYSPSRRICILTIRLSFALES
mmetsp:Transcript_1102/g.1649  ORF Transcript_1102/g.1649 Transcript_1102/m.1649 type:complete len:97 (-) Transcript_1102:26-316(-)